MNITNTILPKGYRTSVLFYKENHIFNSLKIVTLVAYKTEECHYFSNRFSKNI